MNAPEEKKPTNRLKRFLIAIVIVLCIGLLIPSVRQVMFGVAEQEAETLQAARERIHKVIEARLAALPLPGMASPTNVIVVSTGLTNHQDQVAWHRSPEGSDVFPVALFRALKDHKTGRPIIESFESFGLIASPDDSSGLPIGFTRIMMAGNPFVMTGFNCSACHSTQLRYNDKTLQIDGAPNLVDVEKFFRRTLDSAEQLIELGGDQSLLDFLAHFIEYDAIEREKMHAEGVPLMGDPLGPGDHAETLAFLKNKLGTLRRIIKSFDNSTDGGPGRADSFGIIRNEMMIPALVGGHNFEPLTAPVSMPHLFGFSTFTNLHWDGNTTTGNDRNYAQAIALGANFDPNDLVSSVRPYELFKMEQMARLLVPPKWPADVFMKLDSAKVKRGGQLYESAGCAGCHTTGGWHKLEVIGTDPNRLVDYNKPINVGDGRQETYATNLYTSAIAVRDKAYELHNVPKDTQAEMNLWHAGVTPRWITTLDKGYYVRKLRGVWATAPYLHNGSVPTLWDLLQSVDKRPVKFAVGHRDYDPQHVGFVKEPQNIVWEFDTSITGNRNTGHEFGTKLTDDDKWALIEYLKTL
jgi:hypothetical protein